MGFIQQKLNNYMVKTSLHSDGRYREACLMKIMMYILLKHEITTESSGIHAEIDDVNQDEQLQWLQSIALYQITLTVSYHLPLKYSLLNYP